MEIQFGVIGFRIYADCVNDISTVSVAKIKYRKPGETTSGDWTATLGTSNVTLEDGTILEANTYIYYDTIEDDIDTLCDWKVQAYVELSGGYKGNGTDSQKKSWALLRVKENL